MLGDDPFAPGPHAVESRTLALHDAARDRTFPCETWRPADVAGATPLVVYSHASGQGRRAAATLCAHLAGHGFTVAALDHSEIVARALATRDGESAEERAARVEAIMASRVPDVRFLLDALLLPGASGAPERAGALDASRVGLVGHSFGGWTVLAAPDVEPRVRAIVAMAPAGSANPRPGILPVRLGFAWGRIVPTLVLTGDSDVMTPLDGVSELFERLPEPKRLVVLRRADHLHFLDAAAREHEALRALSLPGEAAWIPRAMRPFAELCPQEEASLFARGLATAHLAWALRGDEAAQRWLAGDLEAALAGRGIAAFTPAVGRRA